MVRNPKHTLGAAWRETRKRTTDAASAGMSRAEAADPDRVRQVKDAGGKIAKRAEGMGHKATRKRNELTLRLAASPLGAKAGRRMAKLGGRMSSIPILSLPADVFNEKNGINELTQRLQREPENPFTNLVLAESISRMQREMLAMVAVRTAVTMSPTTLLMRESMKTAGALGRANELPVVDKLLKRAYGLAMNRLREHPGDPASLHVVARVYLAKRNPEECLKPALLGVSGQHEGRSGQESGPLFYTLSRAYQSLRNKEKARLAAEASIEDEFSLGWLTLGDLVYDDPELVTTAARSKAHTEALERVVPDDLVAYAGIRPQAGDVLRSVLKIQKSKAVTSYTNVNGYVKRAQGAMAQRITSARTSLSERIALPVTEPIAKPATKPVANPVTKPITERPAAKDSSPEGPGKRPDQEADGTSDG